VDTRPTASELLRHPFVLSAADEAIAAGNQGVLARRQKPATIAPASSESHAIAKQINNTLEEAADHTLACQATGLLC